MEVNDSSDSDYEEKPSFVSFEVLDIDENQLHPELPNQTQNDLHIQSQVQQSVTDPLMPIITNTISTCPTTTGMPNTMIPNIQNTTAAPILPIHMLNPGDLTSNVTGFYVIEAQKNWAMPVVTNSTTATLLSSQASIMQTTTVPTMINSPAVLPNLSPQRFVAPQASTSSFSNQHPLGYIMPATPRPPSTPRVLSTSTVPNKRKKPNTKTDKDPKPIIFKKIDHSQSDKTLRNIQLKVSAPLVPKPPMASLSLSTQTVTAPPPGNSKMDTTVTLAAANKPRLSNGQWCSTKPTTSKAEAMLIDQIDKDGVLDKDLLKALWTSQAVQSVTPPEDKVLPKIVSVQGSGVKCLVDACRNTTGNPPPGVDFFTLPKNKELRQIWLKTVHRADLTHVKNSEFQICSNHFTKDVMISKRVRTLKPYAVPYISKSKDTDNPLAKQTESKTMDKIKKLMMQLKKKLPKRDPAHSREFKYFALNLRIGDPIAYKFFKPLFKLPPERSLRDLQVFIPPLNEKMISCVEAKLRGLPAEARQCALAITRVRLSKSFYYNITRDEIIGLERLSGRHQTAEQALVIMVRGLRVPWNQLVGYTMFADVALSHNQVKQFIHETIIQLSNVGVEVMAVITKENAPVLTQPTTLEEPYYTVNESKIYHIVDVPTMMAELYRTMFKNPFTYKDVLVDFNYIQKAYAIMKNSPFKFMQKVTERYIRPGPEELGSPAAAAAVLARPVASAVLMSVFSARLPPAATSTANFINAVSDIYDLANSSPSDSNTTPYTFSSAQVEALEKGIAFFSNLKQDYSLRDVSNLQRLHKTCLAFVKSLSAMKLLMDELRARGDSRIWTRRFQLKPLDSAVARIHARCLHAPPTPVEFVRAFSKVYLRNLLDHSALVKHSIPHSELCANVQNKYIPTHSGPVGLALGHEIDYHFKLPIEDPMKVVVSYLVSKCLEQHACDLTTRYFMVQVDQEWIEDGNVKYMSKKEFAIPSGFKDYIDQLETCYYCSSVETFVHADVGLNLLKMMNRIEFACPCKCFPRHYLIKLFIRLRLYHTLKFNNSLSKAKNFISHHLISMREYDAVRQTLPGQKVFNFK